RSAEPHQCGGVGISVPHPCTALLTPSCRPSQCRRNGATHTSRNDEKTPAPHGEPGSCCQAAQRLRSRVDRNLLATATILELHDAVDQREQRVISPTADIAARVELRAP